MATGRHVHLNRMWRRRAKHFRHGEADALEHAISPRLEEAMAKHLGEPLEDPHGHPIPTSEGALAKRDLKSLDQFRPGQSVIIREAQDDNPDRLRRWQTLGLTPGA